MKKNLFNNRLSFVWIFLVLILVGGCMPESLTDVEPDLQLDDRVEQSSDNEDGANLRINSSAQNKILAEIRKATARYHRLEVAEADGYILDAHCVVSPQGLGGMGQHAPNFDLISNISVDPSNPEVLLYETGKNGQKKLVAVEFLVPSIPWDAQNDGRSPMLGAIPFDDHREIIMVDGNPVNAKGGPPFPHYQLHVWVWKNNPRGMYIPYNPNVNCDYATH
jgi:hypothetical protein